MMTKSILDKNAKHIRLISGNNDSMFICDDLVSRNFDEYIHYHLKKKGFEKIIFFDGAGNFGEYYLDEHSARLVREKASQPKRRSRVNLLDDEEVVEDFDKEDKDEDIRLKYPQMTTNEFYPTYQKQINDSKHKTAIIFSNFIHFMNGANDSFHRYYDLINYGWSQDFNNLTIFLVKDQDLEKIEDEFKNQTNHFFLNLFQPAMIHKVGSPDNHEIELFLRKLKIMGMNTEAGLRMIDLDEEKIGIISEIIRMGMLSLNRKRNQQSIQSAYANTQEENPLVSLNQYFTMGEIYSKFENYLKNSQEEQLYIDEKIVRNIFDYQDEIEENAYDVLMHTKGWEKAAEVISKQVKQFQQIQKDNENIAGEVHNRLEIHEDKQLKCPNYMLIGNPGVGKTTLAKLIGRIFKDCGVLRNGDIITVNSSNLIGEYVGQTKNKTNRLIDSARGSVLIIDEAYSLYSDPQSQRNDDANYRQEAINILVSRALDNDVCIILAGYEKTRKLYEMNEGLQGRFEEIEIESYQSDLLEEIFRNLCEKDHISIDEDIELSRFFENLKKFSVKRSFSNARAVNNIYKKVKQNMKSRNVYANKIIRDDFKDYERYFLDSGSKDIVNKIQQEIDQKFVGMDNLKEYVEYLRYKIIREKEAERKGVDYSETQRHILLIGKPGTGKTQTAKLLSKFFYETGVLGSQEMISIKAECTSAADLAQIIEKANDEGKMLFIDEANYYCHLGNAGRQLITPLLNPSEDYENYPDLKIVMAIYPENKDSFYMLDKGLKRRFQEFHLQNYTGEQLYQIFEINRQRHKIEIADEKDEFGHTVQDYLKAYFIYQVMSGEADEKNANIAVKFEEDISLAIIKRRDQNPDEIDAMTLQDFPQQYKQAILDLLNQ